MKWQYEMLIKQLLLLQTHAEDSSCPCKSEGEMCARKHLLTIEALAEETATMETSEGKQSLLKTLAMEAKEQRRAEEGQLCGNIIESPEIAAWARDKRKELETYSLACSLSGSRLAERKMPEEAAAVSPEPDEATIYIVQEATRIIGEGVIKVPDPGDEQPSGQVCDYR